MAQATAGFESKLRAVSLELQDREEQLRQRDGKLRDQSVTMERLTAELKAVHVDLQREQCVF